MEGCLCEWMLMTFWEKLFEEAPISTRALTQEHILAFTPLSHTHTHTHTHIIYKWGVYMVRNVPFFPPTERTWATCIWMRNLNWHTHIPPCSTNTHIHVYITNRALHRLKWNSPKSNRGFICDRIWVNPSCKKHNYNKRGTFKIYHSFVFRAN